MYSGARGRRIFRFFALIELSGEKMEQQIKRTLAAVGDGDVLWFNIPAASGVQQGRKPVDKSSVTSCAVVLSGDSFKLFAVGKQVNHSAAEAILYLGNAGRVTSSEKPHVSTARSGAFEVLHQRQDS